MTYSHRGQGYLNSCQNVLPYVDTAVSRTAPVRTNIQTLQLYKNCLTFPYFNRQGFYHWKTLSL